MSPCGFLSHQLNNNNKKKLVHMNSTKYWVSGSFSYCVSHILVTSTGLVAAVTSPPLSSGRLPPVYHQWDADVLKLWYLSNSDSGSVFQSRQHCILKALPTHPPVQNFLRFMSRIIHVTPPHTVLSYCAPFLSWAAWPIRLYIDFCFPPSQIYVYTSSASVGEQLVLVVLQPSVSQDFNNLTFTP